MSSTLKSETARLNGAKSKGPITPEGKAKSSQNALRHGLTANSPTLPTESDDDFQTLLDAYLDRYHPADAIETELVQTMATTRWRLRRIGMIESCMLENTIVLSRVHLSWQFETIEDDNRVAHAFGHLANSGRALDLLIRYEAALNRAYDRAVKQLDLLQNRQVRNEPTKPLSAPLPVTSLRSPDPTRAVPIALKDFHLLEEMLRQPPPEGERHKKAA